MRAVSRLPRLTALALAALCVTACGGDYWSAPTGAAAGNLVAPHTLGGSVTGQTGNGLVLVNEGVALAVSGAATSFTFPSALSAGTRYAISVQSAPAGQACTVANGNGTMPASDVRDVQVACGPPETVLHAFAGGTDGANPNAGLVEGGDGNFYGVTPGGGTSNNGTVFRITPSGTETVLYRFAGQPADGASPYQSGLILASDGNFYGTTNNGGAYGNKGTVFRITPAGTETVLWSFGNGSDGAYPNIGLMQATDGNFYGTTTMGGAFGAGTIFRITPAGAETVLWSFNFSTTDASYPYAGLTEGSDGNFYGVAGSGGTSGSGGFYRITPSGTEALLFSFGTTPAAASPNSGLLLAGDGRFYGTTAGGGTYGVGTVYGITPAGVETTLWSFGGGTDANHPNAGMVLARDGAFYGTTMAGGTNGAGALFRITTSGSETVLWSFGGGTDGAVGNAPLIQGSDGYLYGMTENGGTAGKGTVFRYIP